MTKIRVALNKRSSHKNAKGQYPLILNVGHKRKAREIPFNLYLKEKQYDESTGKITGIENSVRKPSASKRSIPMWITGLNRTRPKSNYGQLTN